MALEPTHYWLFDKIKVTEVRERALYDALRVVWGEAEEVFADLCATYGEPIGARSLEEISAGAEDPDAFVAELIGKVEAREAALFNYFYGNYGDEVFELAEEAFRQHGRQTGQQARMAAESDNITPKEIFDTLRNYLLEGPQDEMDYVPELLEEPDGSVIWKHAESPHAASWEAAGAPVDLLLCLEGEWVKAFVRAMNPSADYRRRISGSIYEETIRVRKA